MAALGAGYYLCRVLRLHASRSRNTVIDCFGRSELKRSETEVRRAKHSLGICLLHAANVRTENCAEENTEKQNHSCVAMPTVAQIIHIPCVGNFAIYNQSIGVKADALESKPGRDEGRG